MLHLEIPQLQFTDPAVLNSLFHRGPVKEGDASVLLQQLEDYMHTPNLGHMGKIRQPDILYLQVLLQYIPCPRPRLPDQEMLP